MKKILIMTAVAAERDAVLRGLQGDPRFKVIEAGVGPIEAAVRTATELALAADNRYELVISAGIAGGFNGVADVGSLVVASSIVAADLGAETPDGFLSLDELGFGSATIATDEGKSRQIVDALCAAKLPARYGPILTLATVTGSAATADKLALRVSGAAAEAMEGFGIAAAARHQSIPIVEIRAISNAVGPRDRSAWRIKDALQALEAASSVLVEVL